MIFMEMATGPAGSRTATVRGYIFPPFLFVVGACYKVRDIFTVCTGLGAQPLAFSGFNGIHKAKIVT